MIVWGGDDGSTRFDTGGIYDPATDTWTATSTAGVPTSRSYETAVWTGSRMIVWGGWNGALLNTGGTYDPATDRWAATSTVGAPSARRSHTAVWAGSKMIVWGGYDGAPASTGGIYDPATDTWAATSTVGAPSARSFHKALWTGSRMIVWGGNDNVDFLDTGGIYDPATDTWTTMSTLGAPLDRNSSTVVWTGSEMILWGGDDGMEQVNTGAVYHLATDTWTQTSAAGAPSPRYAHTAIWTGSRMIVWGGFGPDPTPSELNTGGIYDPVTDTWTPTTAVGAPSARDQHTAVWTGSRMIIWGGIDYNIPDPSNPIYYDTGGLYAPPGGPPKGPLVAATERVFPLVSLCGIPDGARSVSVNLTVTQPSTAGNLRLYPAGTPLPTVSSINYSAGQTRANNAIAMPNVWGELAVWCAQASGTAHLVLDVNGYFDASGLFFTLTPCRLVDTRSP